VPIASLKASTAKMTASISTTTLTPGTNHLFQPGKTSVSFTPTDEVSLLYLLMFAILCSRCEKRARALLPSHCCWWNIRFNRLLTFVYLHNTVPHIDTGR
jgi:hypothetical protein